jgi:hypothetical protein
LRIPPAPRMGSCSMAGRRVGPAESAQPTTSDNWSWRPQRCKRSRTPTSPRRATEARHSGSPRKRATRNRRSAVRLRRFVEGPVVTLPRGRNASFTNTGMTPIPGAGTIYPSYRVKGDWGALEAASVLVSSDGRTLTLPGPARWTGRRSLAPIDHYARSGLGRAAGRTRGDTQVVRQDP